jgi:hypothetical protein
VGYCHGFILEGLLWCIYVYMRCFSGQRVPWVWTILAVVRVQFSVPGVFPRVMRLLCVSGQLVCVDFAGAMVFVVNGPFLAPVSTVGKNAPGGGRGSRSP